MNKEYVLWYIFINVVLTIIGYFLYYSKLRNTDEIWSNPHSISKLVIKCGIIIFLIAIWFRVLYYGIPFELGSNYAKIYFDQTLETIRAIFTGFILAFAILWAFGISKKLSATTLAKLSTALLYFLLYIIIGSFLTFIVDFRLAM